MVLSVLVWCLLSLLGIGATSYAYPTPVDFDGELSRWNIDRDSAPLLYSIEADDEAVLGMYQFIIEDAAALWNAVSGSYIELALANEGDTPDVYLYLKRELKDAPFSAGYSLFSAYNDDGSPKTCEIHIAATTRSSFRGIGKTALHEFGHCLGLGHSLIPEAIMSYRLDKNDYELDIDDEAALSRLYPMDGSDPKLPPGCSVLPQRASGQVPAWVWWVALLLPLTSSFRAFGRWRPLPLQQHPREP